MTVRAAILATAALVVPALAGCSGGDGSGAGGTTTSGGGAVGAAPARGAGVVDGALAAQDAAGPQPVGTGVGTGTGLPQAPPAVIRTAELDLRVPAGRAGRALERAGDVAADVGGFVLTETRSAGRRGEARAVLRVPVERFDEALTGLRGLGTLRSEDVHGEDVGLELVDLDARIAHLDAQRRALVRLMQRARSVRDTIRVQTVLSGVQLEAERLEARRRYLSDRVSLATITLDVREAGSEPAAAGSIDRAFTRAGDGAVAVVAAVIVALGFAIPAALLLAAVAGGTVLAVRRLRRRPEPREA